MTTTELGPSRSERLNPRNWTLAWKLIAIGLVPALLALALGVLRIADQADDAALLGESNQLLEIRGQVAVAADALRQERDEAAVFVAGDRAQERGVLDIGIGQTEAGVQEALATVRATEEFDDTTRTALGQTENALGQLDALRNDVGASPNTGADAVIQRYTGVIARVDGLDRAMLRQLRTPDVVGLADALTAATGAGEQLAVQHTVLGAAIRAGQLRPIDVAASVAADNRLTAEYGSYQVSLTPEQLSRFGALGGSESNADLEIVKSLILNTPTDRPVLVEPAEWDAAYNAALTAVQGAGGLITDEMVAASSAAEESASNQAGINSVVLMLGLLTGITIAVLIARALIRSLRVLRTAALDVAERRLPQVVESMQAGQTPDVTVDPVPITSRDEVGQVARAFDAVHGQAVRLAADQAALRTNVSSMFVNLSRRSQVLVERQLQLIEQLESNEQDPDQLSNLFQLDHLATRMRRNSENLLVLAGTDLAKRNISPVPMVDVLRAAVSEIEQYQRIVVQAPPTTTIVGRAASDLVHLLAELLDNATNFSPPDSQVVMSTTRTVDGAILVEIADRGVGMVEHELANANQRLGGPSSVDVSASRRMGLFVVGRLGARHGIEVQLSASSTDGPGTGLTASVTVPAQLVPMAAGEVPRRAAEDAGSAPVFGVSPQRAAVNGNGRPGTPSAFVSGTDVPSAPPAAFDPGHDNAAHPGTNGFAGPPVLPTRRPGSSLHQAGFGPARGSGSSDGDVTPSVAEQARQDQLAAERAETARFTGRTDDDTAAYPVIPPQNAAASPDDVVDAPERADVDRARHAITPPGDAAPDEHAAHALAEPDGALPHEDDRADDTAGDPDYTDAEDAPDRPAETGGTRTQGSAAPQGPTSSGAGKNGSGLRNPWPNGDPPHGPGNGPAALPMRRPSPSPAGSAAEGIAAPTTPMPAVGGTLPVPEPADTAGPDELFAPTVSPAGSPAPVESGPSVEDGAQSLPLGARPPDRPSGFEMGETTPIFEEIASAWFRSNRPLPVDWEDEAEGAQAATSSPPARPRPAAAQPPAPLPVRRPLPPLEPVAPPVARSAPPMEATAFATTADEGWRAADDAEPTTARPDELTAAGLPKRRPRARLIPGSAGSAVLAPPVSPARNAESVRGRLASYQQGVRQGRESRSRNDASASSSEALQGNEVNEPANAGGNHDEERS